MRSMTGFARLEASFEWGTLTWEVRSVNHRYLEPGFRLTDTCRFLEPKLREKVREQLQRGKVDCTLLFQPAQKQQRQLQINQPLAQQYIAAAQSIGKLLETPAPLSALDILQRPGVIEETTLDTEVIGKEVLALFTRVLRELSDSRQREGDALAQFLLTHVAGVEALVADVRTQLPTIVELQRERLHARLAELRAELDVNRLEQEITLFAQKCDVNEELDRLGAHIAEVRRIVREDSAAGRRLDFLMQEFNREANTLSSKSVAIATTKNGVEMKVLIEQMREQVQNIE